MSKRPDLPDHILDIVIAEYLNEADDQEKEQLRAFLASHPECLAACGEYRQLFEELQALSRKDPSAAWGTESLYGRRMYFPKNRGMFYRGMIASAAVLVPLLVIVTTYFLFFAPFREPASHPRAHDEIMASARGARATLVLSPGDTLALDNRSEGMVFDREGVRFRQIAANQLSYTPAETVSQHSLIIPRAGEYRVVLSDGTSIYVNSDSQLDYPTVFDGNERRVSLSGEAYFDVASDDRPFVISTPSMEVTVTGTEFNICNYPGQAAVTTLVKGSLSVSGQMQQDVALLPGQQAVFGHKASLANIGEVNTAYFTSWVDGLFIFYDMPLGDLAVRMERWYDVQVAFNDTALKDVRFTGAMQKDKPVGYLVRLIEEISDVRFHISEDHLLVLSGDNNHPTISIY